MGMTWMKVTGGKLESNIVQFFSPTELEQMIERFQARDGDVLMMVADNSPELVNHVLGNLRLHVAQRLGLISDDLFCPLWVTDFPMFELKSNQITSTHHPFTMPDRTDFDPEDPADLLTLKSRAYDLVMNGEELGGGSIRIHRMDIQRKIFQALGLGREEMEAKFGFFLKALEFGAPPHGGIALGLDRVVATILKTPSIRDIIAFPKNRSAVCPMTDAPSSVDEVQLKELDLLSGTVPKKSPAKTSRPADKEKGTDTKISEKISEKEVLHVAKLARLEMDDVEAASYNKELNSILDYVEALEDLDTEGVAPMRHILEVRNVWRDDIPAKPSDPDTILDNAPERETNYFKVPKVIEG
jgi:aspartyl-tRNA synthetase